MTVPASLSKCAHPPRSNTPRSSSSGPPGPCITPSTETCVVVVSFMLRVPSGRVGSRTFVHTQKFGRPILGGSLWAAQPPGQRVSGSDRGYGDDDLAGGVPLREGADGVGCLGEREGSTDDRLQLAVFDQPRDRFEVVVVRLRGDGPETLAGEQGQEGRSEHLAEEPAGPVAAAVSSDDHERSLRGQRAAGPEAGGAPGPGHHSGPTGLTRGDVLAGVVDDV